MATSRYRHTKNSNSDYHDTFDAINANDVISDTDIFYVVKDDDRLDSIARKFLGDGRYWWIIALVNDIAIPFGDSMKPGTIIRIPTNISSILMKT